MNRLFANLVAISVLLGVVGYLIWERQDGEESARQHQKPALIEIAGSSQRSDFTIASEKKRSVGVLIQSLQKEWDEWRRERDFGTGEDYAVYSLAEQSFLDELLVEWSKDEVVQVSMTLARNERWMGTVLARAVYRRWGFLASKEAMGYFFEHCDFTLESKGEDPFDELNNKIVIDVGDQFESFDAENFYGGVFEGVVQKDPELAWEIWQNQRGEFSEYETFGSISQNPLKSMVSAFAKIDPDGAVDKMLAEKDLLFLGVMSHSFAQSAEDHLSWGRLIDGLAERQMGSAYFSSMGFYSPILAGWARANIEGLESWYEKQPEEAKKEYFRSAFGEAMSIWHRDDRMQALEVMRARAASGEVEESQEFVQHILLNCRSYNCSSEELGGDIMKLMESFPNSEVRNQAMEGVVKSIHFPNFSVLFDNSGEFLPGFAELELSPDVMKSLAKMSTRLKWHIEQDTNQEDGE